MRNQLFTLKERDKLLLIHLNSAQYQRHFPALNNTSIIRWPYTIPALFAGFTQYQRHFPALHNTNIIRWLYTVPALFAGFT